MSTEPKTPTVPMLFKPYSIGQLQLRNRIVIPPMCMYSAVDGKMGAFHHMHVGSMATSGAGLFIIEATAVRPEGRISSGCCGIWDDETAAAMKAVLDEVRTYSQTPIALQLAHAGRKASDRRPFDTLEGQVKPGETDSWGQQGWQVVAPSAIPFNPADHPPLSLSVEEIANVVQAFADAAVRADKIGIDGIELHFAHGYLACEFLSPLSNKRTDAYGGSLENRMRMPLEVFRAVRAVVPKKKPVWARISATEWMDAKGGWTLDDSIVFCKKLKELGCDAIHVSSGGNSIEQKIEVRVGYQLPFAKAIKEAVGINVIGVGMLTEPGEAEAALVGGAADSIAIGRQMLFNPHWPYEAAHKLRAMVDAPPPYWRSEPNPKLNIFMTRRIPDK
ncbi:n-ethylmaleimide reductase-like protein [Leptomonas pyrrhocoris]|uniref:N-ethylmaleimide reductase-like protein n=1 Tax=Leptomonas pyrrhocoris TaxID=157538 RepID=A0A0N0E037_LEPPY|nr:n-ethylmaleimide reductase-like protein [Leptomonas pyrrhocoris]KPA85985.1 n-ethylmaleimide reductase-like protein [Leptomonas pyrrhocoris]|eukprot:XP_015664424.1 n-ethylmaleimide reductase-like protein [Leptomonas pyrrhocoris]